MNAFQTLAMSAMATPASQDSLRGDQTGVVMGGLILLGIVITARALWGIHVARQAYSELCVHKAIIESSNGVDVSYETILQRCDRRFPKLSVRRIDAAIYRLTEKQIIASSAGPDGNLIIRIPPKNRTAQTEAA